MDIEKFGKQAGIWTQDGGCVTVSMELAIKFAELISAEEREACAQICDGDQMRRAIGGGYSEICANAIRMRSNVKYTPVPVYIP